MSNENLPVSYEDRLAEMAKRAVSVERPTGSSIGLKAGQLTYNGTAIPGNKLDAIVIASTHANLFYTERYDPDALSNPVCWAYGDSESDMAPHPEAPSPQHTECKTCPHNQFGTAANGKGKACKNSRHLALIPAGTAVAEVPTAEVAVLKLPVMSVKEWGKYVNKVATLYRRPPLGVITQISTTPDPKSQFRVLFNTDTLVEHDVLDALFNREAEALQLLHRVYEANAEAPAAPAKGKKY